FAAMIHTSMSSSHFYALSLHDALPIFVKSISLMSAVIAFFFAILCLLVIKKLHFVNPVKLNQFLSQLNLQFYIVFPFRNFKPAVDRKSTRLNSSQVSISYAVFCLKKKK